MLSVRGLSGAGVEVDALDLADGECVALTGRSGAGKSRLLRALADLDPCRGEVRLDGRSWHDLSAPEWRRHVIYVAAEPGWWATHVDQHFLDSGALPAALEHMLLAAGLARAPIAELSTGERQRISLLRALERTPRVLLLDEPTSALDAQARDAVETLLREQLSLGTSILIVTHDAEQTARLASRGVRVVSGRLETGDES